MQGSEGRIELFSCLKKAGFKPTIDTVALATPLICKMQKSQLKPKLLFSNYSRKKKGQFLSAPSLVNSIGKMKGDMPSVKEFIHLLMTR